MTDTIYTTAVAPRRSRFVKRFMSFVTEVSANIERSRANQAQRYVDRYFARLDDETQREFAAKRDEIARWT